MQVVGIGRVIFWSGGSLWIGKALAPGELHSHHATQVSVGLTGRVQFKSKDAEPWASYEAVIIPPDLPHAFQAPGQTIAHVFCEPESALGRALLKHGGGKEIKGIAKSELGSHAKSLHHAYAREFADQELEYLALELLFSMAGNIHATPADQRVLKATAFIANRLAEPLTLENVAEHVGLSSSRFRHLFVAETGISFRAYVLWARLNRALELGFGGTSWTAAAHAANFADSAHLSRTTRRIYGIAPSALLAIGGVGSHLQSA